MSVRVPPERFIAYFPVREFVSRINRGWPAQGRATSWWRSVADNVRVGGSGPRPYGNGNPNFSQHLVGLAADLTAPNVQRAVDQLRAQGLIAVNEFDHIHVQAWPAGELNRHLTG